MSAWHRMSVDLDHLGHPLGVSVEAHADEDTVRLSTEACGPFDTVEDAIAQVMRLRQAMLPLTLF